MRVHIDWLTFSMAMIYPSELTGEENKSDVYAETIRTAFLRVFGDDLTKKAFGGKWVEAERSRAPYTQAWRMGEYCTMFASPTLVHMCVEISGAGCEMLIAKNLMNDVLSAVHQRCTRIDIACDVETPTTPPEFVSAMSGKRMSSIGYQKSSTGETCYVGSQKSDRYARIYRYAPPHPRSNLLRIEHVFRKDYAKSTALACVTGSLESVAEACRHAFGWAHRDYETFNAVSAPLSRIGHERGGGGTVHWLITSAASAFKKQVASGVIKDPEAFLETYFLGEA